MTDNELVDWNMEFQVKSEMTESDEDENGTENAFPVWQMIQDDEESDETYIGENVTRLTGNVRACYLDHLQKTLIKNYEMCSARDRVEWPFSTADLRKCAAWMEQKALRSCMVLILYQRAMTGMAADIKKHTEQMKIYRRLKDYITFDSAWSTKTTQTSGLLVTVDKETQTESSIDVQTSNNGYQNQSCPSSTKRKHLEPDCEGPSIASVNIKSELPTPPKKTPEPEIRGIPIPVYVTGMTSSVSVDFNIPNFCAINNTQTLSSISDTNDNTNSTNFPLLNGIEPLCFNGVSQVIPNIEKISNVVQLNNHEVKQNQSESDVHTEEPFEWSVIESQTKTPTPRRKQRVKVRRLSDLQENPTHSSGTNNEENSSEQSSEETHHMSLDERLTVLGVSNSLPVKPLPIPPPLPPKTVAPGQPEPSFWTTERIHQEELLRDTIIKMCADVGRRGRLRLRFIELFGTDSDDFFDIEDQLSLHRDKVAHWMVECLMPYYREGRIGSRPVFKLLAKNFTESILEQKRWPSESDVMKRVVEFFTRHLQIQTNEDIPVFF